MATLEIKSNGWSVKISLDALDTYEVGAVVKEISSSSFNWENFSKGDDLWFEGDLNLTCTHTDKNNKTITFLHLKPIEKFCIAMESGNGIAFMDDEESYPQLSGNDMRKIISAMLEVIDTCADTKEIWREIKDLIDLIAI